MAIAVTGAGRAMNDDRAKPTLNVWALVGIGSYTVGCLVAGLGLGWFVDSRVHTYPAFTLVGIGCGIAAGVVGTWVRIRPFLRD
jgi:F0F1-type ATP synthase assembly protein I